MTYKKWECIACGYIYDEELGNEEEGFPPGTRFEDIPDDWCLVKLEGMAGEIPDDWSCPGPGGVISHFDSVSNCSTTKEMFVEMK